MSGDFDCNSLWVQLAVLFKVVIFLLLKHLVRIQCRQKKWKRRESWKKQTIIIITNTIIISSTTVCRRKMENFFFFQTNWSVFMLRLQSNKNTAMTNYFNIYSFVSFAFHATGMVKSNRLVLHLICVVASEFFNDFHWMAFRGIRNRSDHFFTIFHLTCRQLCHAIILTSLTTRVVPYAINLWKIDHLIKNRNEEQKIGA